MSEYKNYETIKLAPNDFYSAKIEKPKQCPYCHTFMDAKVIVTSEAHNRTGTHQHDKVAITYQCSSCGNYFLANYNLKQSADGRIQTSMINLTATPNIEYPFDDEIEAVSPMFKTIYKQSQLAEYYGLSELTGMGYRKALEYLLKDYYNAPNKPLAQIINSIETPSIQSLAKLSAWIGNDQTHTEPKHPDKDIDDMKKFIKAMIHHISMELITKEATDYINS